MSDRVGVRAGRGDAVWKADYGECSQIQRRLGRLMLSISLLKMSLSLRRPCLVRGIVPCYPSAVTSDGSYSYALTGAVNVAWVVITVGMDCGHQKLLESGQECYRCERAGGSCQ